MYPENTALAFKKAVEYPIWGIECDVHMTKDGQVVICHDERIDRTSNGKGLIKDLSLSQLREYNFYGKFPEQASEDTLIWTLEEFFEWFAEEAIKVNIELKTNIFPYPGIVDAVADSIEKYDMLDRVIISSFNHESILDIKARLPEIQTAFLTMSLMVEPHQYLLNHSVDAYHPLYFSVNERIVKGCHSHSIKVHPYTIDDLENVQKMYDLGVDAVITNQVDKVYNYLNRQLKVIQEA